jgi:SAM-dependent methyltransferase
MKCRVCGSARADEIGEVEYVAGYSWKVSACPDCACLFTQHDDSIYERLHASGAISYYSDYRDLAARCRALFDRKDRRGLKELLCQWPKYRFVIEEIERQPAGARLLEIGCSRGYLTSISILDGRDVLGVDVSSEAVESALGAFGRHFVTADAPAIARGAPYDVIYHVGMIGCVADPLGFTQSLLQMLKPGGKLLFNAPNRDSCYLRGQLWIDSAPPPDLVTLFAPGFWKGQCAGAAEVQERVEAWPADKSLAIGLRKLFGRQWRKPVAIPLAAPRGDASRVAPAADGLWQKFEQSVAKLGRVTGLDGLAPAQPSEFGLFVKMTKKSC